MARSPIRQHCLGTGLLAACFNLAVAAAVAATDADGPGKELRGSWKLHSVEAEGEARQLEDDVRWVINDDQVLYGGEPLARLATYPASSPKGLDLAFREPRADYEGIYLLDKDELKICLNIRTTGPKERPFDFATKDKPNWRALVFRRLAPSDGVPGNLKGFVGMALAIENEAVVVNMVLENSPAEKAGLRAGDVLLSIGGEDVAGLQASVDAVRRKMPGSDLRIRVRRDGKEKEIAVKVAVFPFSLLGLLG